MWDAVAGTLPVSSTTVLVSATDDTSVVQKSEISLNVSYTPATPLPNGCFEVIEHRVSNDNGSTFLPTNQAFPKTTFMLA